MLKFIILNKYYLAGTTTPLMQTFDQMVSKVFLKFFPERNSLLTFLFHGIFLNEKEIALKFVDPQQQITLQQFRQFVDYYLEQGYEFISPEDVLAGLELGKNYILLTFDDGYFSNSHVIPVLKEYRIPAVFFLTTSNILQNKSFWWDVLYREMKKTGKSDRKIFLESMKLKLKKALEIEEYLGQKFGKDAFMPLSDIDRPFSPQEIKELAREEFIFFGNHTMDHAILANYSNEEIMVQISGAQDAIFELTGKKPLIISFPNGNYSREVLRIIERTGIKIAITLEPKKNYLPISPDEKNPICLGRFILRGEKEIVRQCETFRSDLALYCRMKNLLTNSYKC